MREQYAADREVGLALGFQDHEIEYMHKVYYDVDVDGDERIVLSEITTMFRRIGITLDPKNQRRVDGWIQEYSKDDYAVGVDFGGFLQVMRHVVQENLGGIIAPKQEKRPMKKEKKQE